VKEEPSLFLDLLPSFHGAKRPYQYGAINGFSELWEASRGKPVPIDWGSAWPKLFSFLEQLLTPEAFWNEPVEHPRDLTPTRDWIPPVVAELLKSGTRSDSHAYSPDLLPRGWRLLSILLEKSEAVDSASENDPMTQAINSPRGKALEGLFLHALRACRLADSSSGSHVDAWAGVKPTFDVEMAKCSGGNYEFSTLCGAYLANLDYLSSDWLVANVKGIFPEASPDNFFCAIAGLAYGAPTRRIYVLLRDSEIVDRAIQLESKARYGREKLIERIALAYLWGEEKLDSSRWSHLFDISREQDLIGATRYFWSVQGQSLSTEQRQRIIDFWERTIDWARTQSPPPTKLMAALATLSCYLQSADGKDRELLLAVAPFVHLEHATHDFIEELQRLVTVSPAGVSKVLGGLLEAHVPLFDYQDGLKSLLTTLHAGGRKEDAIRYANMARSLRGMEELFNYWVG
jgi:hypothetical protein